MTVSPTNGEPESRLAYVSSVEDQGHGPVLVTRTEAQAVAEAAQKDKAPATPRVKKHAPRVKHRATQVGHTQVKRDVWIKALTLADGDAHRLVVRSSVNVTVANSRSHADTLRKTI